jgi:GTP-binding protein Era
LEHKAGFVNIIGKPNAGKSTLMNALVGERLSIITSKAQTTRHRIMGIVSGENFQIVYSDTPGFIKPRYGLQKSMMNFVNDALLDADILLYLVDISDPEMDESLTEKVKESTSNVFIILNKVDLSTQGDVEIKLAEWKAIMPNSEVFPISALAGFNLTAMFNRIIELLPESPAYYPKDELTDKPERFFVSEIIREKIFLNYSKEVPYSTEVVVERFKDETKILEIDATIYVERKSQKGIVIGHEGSMLKKVGTAARLEMEKFFERKIFLSLHVKVKENWRDDEHQLKNFGYHQE